MAQRHPTIAHHQRSSRDRIFQKVSNAYGHLTPPEDIEGLYGQCLITAKQELDGVQERLNTIETTLGRPSGSISPRDSYDGNAPSKPSKLDAIAKKLEELDERLEDISDDLRQIKDESKLKDISAELGQIKDENKEILQKIENIEDAVAERANYVVDRAGSANAEIEDVEQRLTGMIDAVEKTQQDVEVESTEKLKTMLDEFRAEVHEGVYNILAARQRNNIVARFHEMVTPVAARNVDAKGRPTFRVPDCPRRAVKYYWKMHDPSYHEMIISLVYKELIADHRFYNIEHTDWAVRLEGNTNSDDDELVRSDPFTLEEAVARYPEQAVMALFSELGLVYSNFRDQELRDQSRQKQQADVEKRPRKWSSVEKPAMKKRNSWGSTTELITSHTQSVES